MNWAKLRIAPWLDTRAGFVAQTPQAGSLLDLGTSDGETLRHFAELRPDLKFFAADLAGMPEKYPSGCTFHRGDLQRDPLPWPDASMSAITCMHLVEHLNEHAVLVREVARLLKPGRRVYFEMPHPTTLSLPKASGKMEGLFSFNFYDDKTHVKLVTAEALSELLKSAGLEIIRTGTSRNWLFAASHPLYLFMPDSRKKYTARAHWVGWSAYVIARKPS